jgi:hypothetical protein
MTPTLNDTAAKQPQYSSKRKRIWVYDITIPLPPSNLPKVSHIVQSKLYLGNYPLRTLS